MLPATPPSARDRARRRTAHARSGLADVLTAPQPWQDRDPNAFGNRLAPLLLTQIIAERNLGFLQRWVDLADEMRRNNPHLHSQLALREQGAVQTEYEVLPGAGTNQRAALRAAAACDDLLEAWRARDDGGWERWVAEFVAASYYGRGAHEVIWDDVDGLMTPVALARIDERRLSYACAADDPDPWALRIWDASAGGAFDGLYGQKLADFHPDKFLVNEPRVAGGVKTQEGIFATVVWHCLFTTWSWRDLMALGEMIGRPPVVAYFAAGGARGNKDSDFSGARDATQDEVTSATRAVKALSGALRAVLPDTIRLDPLHYQIPTGTPVQLLTEARANALISKAIHGVDSVSDLQPGARAAVEVQERKSSAFWRADCRTVERLTAVLFARFVRANPDRFGADCPLPRLRADTEPVRDFKAVLEGIALAQKVGMEVPLEWSHEATGVPQPDADDEVLAAPAPPPLAAPPDPTAPPPPGGAPAAPAAPRE